VRTVGGFPVPFFRNMFFMLDRGPEAFFWSSFAPSVVSTVGSTAFAPLWSSVAALDGTTRGEGVFRVGEAGVVFADVGSGFDLAGDFTGLETGLDGVVGFVVRVETDDGDSG